MILGNTIGLTPVDRYANGQIHKKRQGKPSIIIQDLKKYLIGLDTQTISPVSIEF